MQDFQLVTGMVIHQDPVGDYDRRIVLLTKDSGKISAFAKGARRPNSKYVSTTDLFCFGDFKLYAGRDSFTVTDVSIKNYFSEIRADLDASLYGMYFLEVVEYKTRQFNDELNILRLLYSSVKALGREDIPNSLVKLIFEFKLYFLQGEFAIKEEWRRRYKPSTIYTLEFIGNTKPEKLYSFSVSDEVMKELVVIAKEAKRQLMPASFKSEEMLKIVEI